MVTQGALQYHKPGAGSVGNSGSPVFCLRIGIKFVSWKVLPPSVETETWQSAVRSPGPAPALVLIGNPYSRHATATKLGSRRLTATRWKALAEFTANWLMLTSEISFPGGPPAQAEPIASRLVATMDRLAMRRKLYRGETTDIDLLCIPPPCPIWPVPGRHFRTRTFVVDVNFFCTPSCMKFALTVNGTASPAGTLLSINPLSKMIFSFLPSAIISASSAGNV